MPFSQCIPSSPAISRGPIRTATGFAVFLGVVSACGGRQPPPSTAPAAPPAAPRVVVLSRAIVLETSGPPPSDTSVTFVAGAEHVIVLRHGPPENIVFARLGFGPGAFADSGQMVTVEVRPRPGVYGLDIAASLPMKEGGTLVVDYSRYFSAPSRARQIYGSDVAFERALAIGRLLSETQIELLPSDRPAPDNLVARFRMPGRYLVAAPQ